MATVHPTAIIHPEAQLDPTVSVGPYAIIDAGVVVGADCIIGPHVHLTGLTTIGRGNRFHTGCVIGGAPQDLKHSGAPTRLRIGDHNLFREHCTVNGSATEQGETVIGSDNFVMIDAHVAHDCHVGHHVFLVNGSMLAGHVVVGDRALISGNCCVHQFVRVGTLSLIQGGTCITQDLPPFTVASGLNTLCGLNTVGLRRAGIGDAERLELRSLYHALFRSGKNMRAALAAARPRFKTDVSRLLLDFVASSQRGVCRQGWNFVESD